MNGYFGSAAIVLFLIGLMHSLLGEHLIFRRMRRRGIVPTDGGSMLREPHVRILWATWHVVTVVGWCLTVVLWWLAQPATPPATRAALGLLIAAALLLSATLVLTGTKGRHPGWIGLLLAGALAAAGACA